LVLSFAVLGWIGTRIHQEEPPVADKIVTKDGTVVIDTGGIESGQNVWQSLGGMEVGSVWGWACCSASSSANGLLKFSVAHRSKMNIASRCSQSAVQSGAT
jgi:nitric oxide reductase large subunit